MDILLQIRSLREGVRYSRQTNQGNVHD
jgi:hypothetical protein